MNDEEGILRTVRSLVSEWSWTIDHETSDRFALLFTEDCLFETPETTCRSRAEVAASAQSRAAGQPVSRHVIGNLELFVDGPNDAHGRGIMTVYRHSGEGMGGTVPSSVFDFVDRYRRDSDGRWRFAERKMTRIFAHPSRVARP